MSLLLPWQDEGATEGLQDLLLLVRILFTHSFHGVLDLTDEKVNLQRTLSLLRLQVGHHDVGEYLTKVLHLGLLNFFIGLLMEFQKLTLEFTYFCKGFDNCEGHRSGPLAL